MNVFHLQGSLVDRLTLFVFLIIYENNPNVDSHFVNVQLRSGTNFISCI